jgi:hypothetical protein
MVAFVTPMTHLKLPGAAVETLQRLLNVCWVELREVTQKMALLRLAGTGEGVSMSGENGRESREDNVAACSLLSRQ